MATADDVPCRGPVCRAESEQSLKCSLWCPAPVMTEDELVKVDLQLMASDSVVGSDEPLLKIPDGAIGEWHDRLGPLSEIRTQWLHTRDMVIACLLQARKLLETVRVLRWDAALPGEESAARSLHFFGETALGAFVSR